MITLKTPQWEIDNIDTVLFDKDGTFIDLHYFWGKMTELRVSEIIKRYKLSKDIFKTLCLKLGYDTDTQKMLPDGITALYSRSIIIEIFCKNLNDLGIKITQQNLEKIFDEVNIAFYKEMQKYTKPIESAINFIKQLHSHNVKIGVVTSDSKESTMLTIKHFAWEELFDIVIGRESTKETKESGVPVKLALKLIGSKPENTVMIGDAPMDYIAAQNAVVENVILVATGQISKKELEHTSNYTVHNLSEVTITDKIVNLVK